MIEKAHNERCKACKRTVKELLAAIFGHVEVNWNLGLSSRVEDFANLNTGTGDALRNIYDALKECRGQENFVRSARLPRVDYFIPSANVIVEFDESQHFSKPRDVALSNYPPGLELGFSVHKWRSLCQALDKHDNDPPYRDEQRAWYDTLRDFAPGRLGSGRTIRLYSRDLVWCSLNPRSGSDLQRFRRTFVE